MARMPEGVIINDPAMEYCPECLTVDAAVRLVTATNGKYCPHHGKITERLNRAAGDE